MILTLGVFFVLPILLNFALASRFARNRLVWALAALPTSYFSTLALLLAGTSGALGPRPDKLIKTLVAAAMATGTLGLVLRNEGLTAQSPDAPTAPVYGVGVAGRPVPVQVNFGSSVGGLFQCTKEPSKQLRFVVTEPPLDWAFQCPWSASWPSTISRRNDEPLMQAATVDSTVMIPADATLGMRRGRLTGTIILARMSGKEFVEYETPLNAVMTIRVVEASTLAGLARERTRSGGEAEASAGNIILGLCAVCGAAAIALCFRTPPSQG